MKSLYSCFTLFVIALLLFSSCKKETAADTTIIDPLDTDIAPDNFNFSTTRELTVSIRLLSNSGEAIKGVLVSVTDPANVENVFFKAATDVSGYAYGTMVVPTSLDTVVISPNYVGLLNNVKAIITSKNSLNAVIGGSAGFSGDVIAEAISATRSSGVTTFGLSTTEYVYPTGYTSAADAVVNTTLYPFVLGRPVYLETTPDVIPSALLTYINSSLPESKPLTTTHPEYLESDAIPNIIVKQDADVWLTFVSEGAGFRNALAYYTFPTGSTPTATTGGTNAGGIDKVTMIFPNSSAFGSSGGLRSGDKVKLGRFTAGTTIGFVLLRDSWVGNMVNTSYVKFYSDAKFNPETIAALKKHTVMLYDNDHSLFLFGFEDQNRQTGSDQDFNDVVAYATSNPASAISKDGVAEVDKIPDADGDGVLDELDDFPNDPLRAYITYSPSKTGWSTLAFEDNWPKMGDYDMNDLVLNYRYTFVKNASNAVVEMKGEYLAVAAGADYKNGFGVQFPFSSSKVSSVTGQSLQSNTYIVRNANGTEAGQTNAVIIPFDNHRNVLNNADNSTITNTLQGKAQATPTLVTVNIAFTAPIASNVFGTAPFNPFLISNLRRGYEIHLPGYKPTDKAISTLMGTEDDKSSVAGNVYYKNKNNGPWALSFTGSFSYPVEKSSIIDTYAHFMAWAKSGGTSFTDWYSATTVGYRNTAKIYSK
ncbi:hypothetical protein ADIARSV_1200 [Arcticibacter svalbardensis MN12-7]|uniref:DUF4842 domain-containing protein n=1 Tax=Arcticibacter svalbardensis MN12-7 TaxID=1150600 RepID=R9H327_9SPHI|nr:LruC domain-containing protein [Arcticibacter svalbardensis]EOR95594.1 hypothetical protein ADIARSV_1200 [Arcticibacter svalbardensis MN12-7]